MIDWNPRVEPSEIARNAARTRILAIDIDGTLVDGEGELSPRVESAIAEARKAGIAIVLCTGRRYRRTLPLAERLGLASPIICNSGALVKEPVAHRTILRSDIGTELFDQIIALFHRHEHRMVYFLDRGLDSFDFSIDRYPSGSAWFDDYVAKNLDRVEVAGSRLSDRPTTDPPFHLFAIGARDEMLAFEREVHRAIDGRVQTFVQKSRQYDGTMCEILRSDASKWSALAHLAEKWGISTEEICAVGDDQNDVPMIEGAGIGVAMGNAPSHVRDAADLLVPANHDDGLAVLIEYLIATRSGRSSLLARS